MIHLGETPEGTSILQRASLDVKLAAPAWPNAQAPHVQDELYIVVRGSGFLFHDGKRERFAPGDLLFVAAGVEHHFEEFGDDLLVWRVFYGPDGGAV